MEELQLAGAKFFAKSPVRKIVRGETCPRVRTALFWAITQRIVVIPYRRFGTTHRSLLQGWRKVHPWRWDIVCPETSVRNYHYFLRYKPEERSSHLLSVGSLKLHLSISVTPLKWAELNLKQFNQNIRIPRSNF